MLGDNLVAISTIARYKRCVKSLKSSSLWTLVSCLTRFKVFILTSLVLASPCLALAEDAKEHKPVTFISIFLNFTPEAVVMWVLLIMSVVMLTIIIELFVKLRKGRLAPPAVIALMKEALSMGNYQQAGDICKANPCYLTKLFDACLERFGSGRDSVHEALGEAVMLESNLVKGRNNYLSVIGVVSPMIGLTGTVLGMMKAFSVLGQSGVANMTGLSSAISEVLICTATGLAVAIPAFLFFYYFKNRTLIVLSDVQVELNKLLRDIPFDQLFGMQFGASPVAYAAGQDPYQQQYEQQDPSQQQYTS